MLHLIFIDFLTTKTMIKHPKSNILLIVCIFFSIVSASSSIIYGNKIYRKVKEKRGVRPSKLALKMLCGKNGIEIGESTQNSFHLTEERYCHTIGGYLNVDFSADQGGKWQDSGFQPAIVNVVATGDALPFKDNSFDYVLSSHVIEHAFDPIKTISEWLRVIKKNGYIFIIAPHKDRTFDKHRDVTPLQELLDRHAGKINVHSYARPKDNAALQEYFKSIHRDQQGMSTSDLPSLLLTDKTQMPRNWERYKEDDHHHWSVWRTEDFLEMCKKMNWKVVEYQDIDDKVGNGFTVVIQK